ncbi:MAG: hypothetical protein HRU40_15125, partial [Saprospiraceae bacterium]|nr:hypothetical protein [Saprospiraceae bacterium]
LAVTFWRFSFTPRTKKLRSKKKEKTVVAQSNPKVTLPSVHIFSNRSTYGRQMFQQARVDTIGVLKSTPFIVILLFGVLNMLGGLSGIASSFYGLDLYPVTYRVIGTIKGTMYISTVGILIFYSGALIWKERDAKVNEIYNSLPYPNWVPVWSKILALVSIIVTLQLICILTGIGTQVVMGYSRFQLGLYIKEFLVIDVMAFLFVGIISMMIHTLVNNKYLAFFVVAVFLIIQTFIWVPLDIVSNMVAFGDTPSYTYSDMNGFGPFVPGLVWFNVYWLLFSLILVTIMIFFWVRGRDTIWKVRRAIAARRFRGGQVTFFAFTGLWIAVAAFVFYNTEILNDYATPKKSRKLAAEYEKTYRYLHGKPQPKVTDIVYEIDLYPETRDLEVRGTMKLENYDQEPIDTLILNLNRKGEFEVEVDGAQQVKEDETHRMVFYVFKPALAPGDSTQMKYRMTLTNKGFENEVSFTQIVDNGSFFNNGLVTPSMGYLPDKEISQKRFRKKFDLPPKELMPPLEHECSEHCMMNYIGAHADWSSLETIMSTSPDQIAVAPGSLIDEWEENGRRYFRYKVDHPSIPFCSFISADFQVEREKWNDVDLEVYYQKEHDYNVENMLRSMRRSLSYFSASFGPYQHRQARIIEFPRYASFAQAFPGTMPYSEGIGFIADIDTATEDIDMVFYVVAHEMAHQWWAHQVIGARMQGATLLSETLAQYSALMVMEKEYGRDKMERFLKYEMDAYLSQRGTETEREKPLQEVYASQGYIHYRKGSTIMYYLKEMIGEDQVNGALRELVDSFAYAPPPYPTSHNLVDNLKKRTPDSLQYLIEDMFENITLFDNRILDPTFTETDTGTYELSIPVYAAKYRADSLGLENEVPVNDFLDVAVFAKPKDGQRRGEVLYWKRHKITQNNTSFRITLSEEPYEVGVDPFYYLIDRMPDDNVKRVKKE